MRKKKEGGELVSTDCVSTLLPEQFPPIFFPVFCSRFAHSGSTPCPCTYKGVGWICQAEKVVQFAKPPTGFRVRARGFGKLYHLLSLADPTNTLVGTGTRCSSSPWPKITLQALASSCKLAAGVQGVLFFHWPEFGKK